MNHFTLCIFLLSIGHPVALAHFCGGLCAEYNHKVGDPRCYLGNSMGTNDQQLCCQICVQWPSCRAWTFERKITHGSKLVTGRCSFFNCIELKDPTVGNDRNVIVSGIHWGALDPISDEMSMPQKSCGSCTKNWNHYIDRESHLALIGGVPDAETCCGICMAFPICKGYSWTVPSKANTWATNGKFQSWLSKSPKPPPYPHCYLEASVVLEEWDDDDFDQVAGTSHEVHLLTCKDNYMIQSNKRNVSF